MENNRTNLYQLILNCKEGDKKSIEVLCNKFSPLIKHYSFYLNNEDAYNYLIITLIKCVNTMPLKLEKFSNDKYILSYIKSSILKSYTQFKISQFNYNNNLYLTEDTLEVENNLSERSYFCNDVEVFLDLKKLLSDKEYLLLQLKYQQGFKDKDIAEMYKITRQAVNKRFKKIKLKLKKYYNYYYTT